MPKIKSIKALEVLDSRGNPTVEAILTLDNGIIGKAIVPSGASTGAFEAHELRDNDKARYGGKGVLTVVANVNGPIAEALIGMDIADQRTIDGMMIKLDGTENKTKLGANAILSVSLAAVKAGAQAAKQPLYQYIRENFGLKYKNYELPYPTMNILNGGAHADWSLDIQEFMIIPQQKIFSDRVRCGAEVFATLGSILKAKGYSTLKGDEGGYAPKLPGNEKAFEYIMNAITDAGYRPGKDVMLAIDAASTEFYIKDEKMYNLKADNKKVTPAEMVKMEKFWVDKYPIASIEDGLAEDDWEDWELLTKELGNKVSLVGDDLFVTNVKRLQQGIDRKVGNAILVKLNQIGSLSETIDAIELAHRSGYKTSISHRSGETGDTTIADLAVAVNSEFIKTGSLSRSERVEKYNRLLEIESELKG